MDGYKFHSGKLERIIDQVSTRQGSLILPNGADLRVIGGGFILGIGGTLSLALIGAQTLAIILLIVSLLFVGTYYLRPDLVNIEDSGRFVRPTKKQRMVWASEEEVDNWKKVRHSDREFVYFGNSKSDLGQIRFDD